MQQTQCSLCGRVFTLAESGPNTCPSCGYAAPAGTPAQAEPMAATTPAPEAAVPAAAMAAAPATDAAESPVVPPAVIPPLPGAPIVDPTPIVAAASAPAAAASPPAPAAPAPATRATDARAASLRLPPHAAVSRWANATAARTHVQSRVVDRRHRRGRPAPFGRQLPGAARTGAFSQWGIHHSFRRRL